MYYIDIILNDILKSAQDVIDIEIAGLTALKLGMGAEISQAVDTILQTQSYLIVVGVGKSGHIGGKIAASFASTGTSAFFMHPTEALHGDMGMISQGCTLLALSNSGESHELRAVLGYAQSLNLPIIAITAHKGSSLAQASDVVLELPQTPEACPNGLAPTTSTTNALALGDALIVAVMKKRGFTRDDFGRRHPAGKLGLQLQSVADWMAAHSPEAPIIIDTAAMPDVIMAISGGGKGCAAVVDKSGKLQGMITDGDLRRAMDANFMSYKAADIMASSPITLQPTMRMSEVVALFTDKRISNAFVVEDNRPIALIDMKTLLENGYV